MLRSRRLPGGQVTIGPRFLEDSEVKGLLFDCDGTLLDSMPLFYHSWVTVCPQFGLTMSENDFYGYAGMPLPDIVRDMHKKQLGADATDDFVKTFLTAKKKAHNLTEERLGHPAPIACVVQLAREAVAKGIPVCVATSGLRDHVEAHLSAAGLSDLFNATLGTIVCAADVPKGKPAPDIFVEAARRIGVRPEDCRAFEDGESGLIAAFSAGCHVVDVTFMSDYPSCVGLREAKAATTASRTWLQDPKLQPPSHVSGSSWRNALLVSVAVAGVAGALLAGYRAAMRRSS